MAKLTITDAVRDDIFNVLGGKGESNDEPSYYWLNQAFYGKNFVLANKDFPVPEILTNSTNGTDSRVDLKWGVRSESGRKVLHTINGLAGNPQMSYPVLSNTDGRMILIGTNTKPIPATGNREGMITKMAANIVVAPKDRQWIMLVNEIKFTVQGDDEV